MNRRIATLIEFDKKGIPTVVYCGNPADMPVRWKSPESKVVVEWTAKDSESSGTPCDENCDLVICEK